ncbi:PEP-CTERM sorting domain-containing protein [Coleofasciculus chthonoplastes]|uniref:PEP-CTERM sorting domain-containing protein n=1 Tax=Coleofasciculus chthonoplastes TaxID=64178 RepID=UPI00330024DD
MNSIYSKISFRAAGVALGVGLATVGMSIVSGVASAATVTRLPDFTDDQFDGLINSGEFTELFVAEGRIGNNSPNQAERELGINDKAGNPVQSAQFVWGNGTVYDFTLEYTGSTVNYNVGGTLLNSTAFTEPIDTIYIRTKETANSNLRLNIDSLNTFSAPSDNDSDDVDYVLIEDISAPFTLTGTISFDWTGASPNRSNLAYQIKVGTKPVPEPLTILGSGLALGFGALLKKESSRKQNKVK